MHSIGLQRPCSGFAALFFTLFTAQSAALAQDSEADGPIVLEPITVEGEKLNRTLREVSPSITIIDQEEAERPSNDTLFSVIRGAANVVAEEGVRVPAIRGIDGSAGREQAFSAGTQPRVPILIDDVARPLGNSASISRSTTWDVNTVEIARGPQSSSTGRNALAGTVRVYTNDPSFDFEAALRGFGFTADGTVGGAAMVNLPLVEDQLALRFTAEGSQGESFVDSLDPTPFSFDPEREEYRRYRGKLLVAPDAVEGLELLFSVDQIRTEAPLPGYIDGSRDDPTITDFANRSSYDVNRQTTYIGRLEYELTDQFKFITRGSRLTNRLEAPDVLTGFGDIVFDQDETEFEGYVQFSDLGVIGKGVVGVIYNEATEDGVANPAAPLFETDGEIENTGVYGELEFDLGQIGLLDNLTLIAGGRFEVDKRTRAVEVFGASVSDQTVEEERFLPKIGLRYEPEDNLTFGYTYSEGFRAGGVDVDVLAPFFMSPVVNVAEFDPETLKQHEIYGRVFLLDDRIEIGASAFFYQYEDAQVPGASPVPSTGGPNLFGNVPEARGYGLEIDTRAQITDEFAVIGAIGLLKTEITDAGPILAAFEGEELPRAPKVTTSLGLEYRHASGLNARIDGRFVGDQVSELGGAELQSYAVLDLAAGYSFSFDNFDFDLEAFVTNVTDKRYFTLLQDPGTAFGEEALGRPRTFGISGTVRF